MRGFVFICHSPLINIINCVNKYSTYLLGITKFYYALFENRPPPRFSWKFRIFSENRTAYDIYETHICNIILCYFQKSKSQLREIHNKKVMTFQNNWFPITEENESLLIHIHVLLLNKYETCWQIIWYQLTLYFQLINIEILFIWNSWNDPNLWSMER